MARKSSISDKEGIECPNCGSTAIYKAGLVDVRQRYRCKECGTYFLNEFKIKRSDAVKRKIAILLRIAGATTNDIASCVGRSFPTVSPWLDHADQLLESEPEVAALRRQEKRKAVPLESFSQIDKKKRWLIIELDEDDDIKGSIILSRKEK